MVDGLKWKPQTASTTKQQLRRHRTESPAASCLPPPYAAPLATSQSYCNHRRFLDVNPRLRGRRQVKPHPPAAPHLHSIVIPDPPPDSPRPPPSLLHSSINLAHATRLSLSPFPSPSARPESPPLLSLHAATSPSSSATSSSAAYSSRLKTAGCNSIPKTSSFVL